jgi:hypothetical protein
MPERKNTAMLALEDFEPDIVYYVTYEKRQKR